MPQRKRAAAHVEGRTSWFLSSCGGVPLKLRQRSLGLTRGASGRSGLHASPEGPLGIPLQSLLVPRSSSGVEAGTSGYLSRTGMDLRVPRGRPQGSQASSHVETCKSPLLSSRKSSVRLSFELTYGLVAFSGGATALSQLPSSFKSIVGVTIYSGQGSQVYLESIGTSGPFGMLARTQEVLSSVKLRLSPLEVRRKCRDFFPDEPEK